MIKEVQYRSQSQMQITTFQSDETNATALVYDGEQSLFVGCNMTPAKIVKVDKQTLKRISSLTLPNGADETRVASLVAVSPEIIIHGSYTNPCIFTRINGRTMEVTGSLIGIEETVNDKYIRPMLFDGQYVYAGCDSVSGKVIKFDPFTMTRVGSVTFPTGVNNVLSMVYLNGFLFASCETSPAKIVKINARTMQIVSTLTLNTVEDIGRAMTHDGRHIYIGTYTSPVQVVKVDPVTMTRVGSYVANTGEDQCFSVMATDNFVYVGTWNEPTTIIKIANETMSRVDAIDLGTGYPADFMYIDQYIYTAGDMNPAQVYRLWKF